MAHKKGKKSSSTVKQVGYEPGGGSAKRKLYDGHGYLPNGANGPKSNKKK